MVMEQRNHSDALIKDIAWNVNRYSMDALLRILSSVLEGGDNSIRFKSKADLHGPWCEVSGIYGRGKSIEIHSNRFGLSNLQSCLPNSYIEEMMLFGGVAADEFLNIFNDKLLRLSFETSKKSSIVLQNVTLINTTYADALKAMVGACGNRNTMYEPLLPHALLFWRKPRSMTGLLHILTSFFKVDFKVKNFIGKWQKINKRDTSFLGKQNMCLGKNLVMGDRVWDQRRGLEITIGPVGAKDFDAFVVEKSLLKPLCFMLAKYLNFGKSYSIKVLIKQSEITPGRLDKKSMLGVNSWIKSKTTYDDLVSVYNGTLRDIENASLDARKGSN